MQIYYLNARKNHNFKDKLFYEICFVLTHLYFDILLTVHRALHMWYF